MEEVTTLLEKTRLDAKVPSEIVVSEWKTQPNDTETSKNSNEKRGSVREAVRSATTKVEGKYVIGDVGEHFVPLVECSIISTLRGMMKVRLSVETVKLFYDAGYSVDPICLYFAMHKVVTARCPTVLEEKIGDQMLYFFYWPSCEGGDKEAKFRLLPSLWARAESERMVSLWSSLSTLEKAKPSHGDYAQALVNAFGLTKLPKESTNKKLDRYLLAAICAFQVGQSGDPVWKQWMDAHHQGLPDFLNMILGHFRKSREWQAYWRLKLTIQNPKTEIIPILEVPNGDDCSISVESRQLCVANEDPQEHLNSNDINNLEGHYTLVPKQKEEEENNEEKDRANESD